MRRLLYIIICITTAIIFSGCGDGKRMRAMLEDVCSRNSNLKKLPTEDTLRMLTDYFDSHGTANERMKSMYVMGCMHMDKGDAPAALKWFHDAVNAADTTAADCDIKTLSRIYGQMGAIFTDMRSPQLAIEVRQKAYDMASKASDSMNAVRICLHISSNYILLGRYDTALRYSQFASQKLREFGARNEAASASAIDYTIYLTQKNYPKAKKALDLYESETGYFDGKGNIAPGREKFYIYKGDYYNGIGNQDSALYYYRKFLSERHGIEDTEGAYRGIMTAYRKLNITDSVAKYSILFSNANDSANIIKSSQEITRLQAVYNYNDIQRMAMKKTSEVRERQLWLYIVTLTSVVVFLVSYILYKVRQRKVQNKIRDFSSRYKRDLSLYLQLKKEMELLQSDHTLLESNMRELRDKLSEYENENKVRLVNNDRKAAQSLIIAVLREMSAKDKMASRQQWMDLDSEMCENMPLFVWKLNSISTPLTEQEQRVCCLARMDFSAQDIAPLMAVSRQRINNIFSTISSKLVDENSARNFVRRIKKL